MCSFKPGKPLRFAHQILFFSRDMHLNGENSLISLFYVLGTIADRLRWSSGDPGFVLHVISTFSEWLMLLFFITYMGTFYKEFKNLRLCEPTVEVEISEDRLAQITPPLRDHDRVN